MDPRAWFQKLRNWKGNKAKALLWIVGGGTALFVVGFGIMIGPHLAKHAKYLFHAGQGGWSISRVFEVYGKALVSVQHKMDELRKAEEQNERLKYENAHLRLKLEAAQFECRSKEAATLTKDYEIKLTKETGSKIGRTLATINYKPPSHLLPLQLYTLGVSYFKARDDEKAAVIFTYLTSMEDSEALKTTKNYLLTAIAWYRVENFGLADQYLDKVLSAQESSDNIQHMAQARLWKALVAKRLNKYSNSQHWLRELIDHHPHATEAAWVNSKEAMRVLSSSED